ncbi:hypothetical protein DSL72_008299 [Monilinia vaccinii-corymbosi]|uniref:Uncharacterized protein n=1 Tax=Monilinia vaccinii-corymbosi TaxID=61207 RepID=A0A8A3PKB6_9HELO|nr:hypothetical protein DSL72_008299 [Monilinia vaccinii-corymbosi]
MADNTPSRRSKPPIPAANVPPTPSRIPVPTQSSSHYPSFASPTKASLARHNPKSLARATSSGPEARRSPGKGRVQDIFDRALGSTPQGERGRSVASDAERPVPGSAFEGKDDTFTRTPTRARSAGGGMASKPRRMSRSPAKRPIAAETPRSNFKPAAEFENVQGIANPFKKAGLRRSPVPGQSSQATAASQEEQPHDDHNPFRKTGLRRSPPAAIPAPETTVPESALEIDGPVSTTPKDPIPLHASITPKDPVPAYPSTTPKEPTPVYASTTPKEPVPVQALEPFLRAPETVAIISRSSSQARSSQLFGSIDVPGPQATEPASPVEPPRASEEEEADDNFELQPEDEVASATPGDPIPPQTRALHTNEPFVIDVPQHQELEDEPLLSALSRVDDMNPLMSDDSPIQRKARQLSMSKPTQRPLIPQSEKSLRSQPQRFQQRAELEEPKLPPASTQRGNADPVVTTAPIGIHSSPSKPARRSKALGAKLRSSPLKPRAEISPEVDAIPEPPAKRRRSARFSIPHDPHAAKRKVRDDLMKELQQLQADVSLANKENERIRLHHESKRAKPAMASNSEEILNLLLRSTAPEKQEGKPESISSLKATNLFLPFSGRRKAQQAILPSIKKPLPSSLPIAHNDDPLSHLQLFSHLTYTSNITLLPPETISPNESTMDISTPALQHHQISACHPSGLFSARLSMVVDTSSLTISSLNVEKLDLNAEHELGPFVRRRSSNDGPFGKDIGTVCWAMGRWTEVSVTRAKFWCDAERQFGTAEARRKSMEKQGKKKKKRKVMEDDVEDDEEREEGRKWTRKELLQQMGRSSMIISGEGVAIRVGWRIGFDWMGDVESSLDIDLDLPSTWHRQDDRNSLTKIKDMFGKLVKEKGPLGALRTTVGLIMAESS